MPAEYNAYMNSNEWRKKRQERLTLDGYQCQMCGSKDHLEVHHVSYERLGKETMDDLITLCFTCHNKIHSAQSLAWCIKRHRYPNAGIAKWAKAKERNRRKNERARQKKAKQKMAKHKQA